MLINNGFEAEASCCHWVANEGWVWIVWYPKWGWGHELFKEMIPLTRATDTNGCWSSRKGKTSVEDKLHSGRSPTVSGGRNHPHMDELIHTDRSANHECITEDSGRLQRVERACEMGNFGSWHPTWRGREGWKFALIYWKQIKALSPNLVTPRWIFMIHK